MRRRTRAPAPRYPRTAPNPRHCASAHRRSCAVVEADRTHEQREQHEQQRVEARERACIDERPGREACAAERDEPGLVAFPRRADRVDDHAALDVRLTDERQQCADAQIEAVGQREADHQHADQAPPDQLQGFIVKHLHASRSAKGAAMPLHGDSARCAATTGLGARTEHQEHLDHEQCRVEQQETARLK